MWVYPFSLRYVGGIVYTLFAQRWLATSFCEKDRWNIIYGSQNIPAKCHSSEREGGQYSDAKVIAALSGAQKVEAFSTTLVIFTINYYDA